MKRVLTIALLLSAAELSAMPYEEAEQRLATAHAKVAAVQKRIEESRSSADSSHNLTKSIDGKHEYRKDMAARKAQVRQAIVRHNKLIETELKEANAHLQEAIKEVGRFHQIVSDGDVYKVVRSETKALEPIRSAKPSRASSY